MCSRKLVLLLALWAPTGAGAAETLTLEAALRESLQGNQQVLNSELQREAAEAGVVGARGVFDPNLQVSGSLAWNESRDVFQGLVFDNTNLNSNARSSVQGSLQTGTSYRVIGTYGANDRTTFGSFAPGVPPGEIKTLQVSPSVEFGVGQEVLRGHRTAFNRRQVIEAMNGLEVAELQLLAQQQRTLRDVATAYWAWGNAVENLRIANDRVAVAQEAFRVGQLQLREGRLAPVDVSRLQTELVRAEKARADATQAEGETSDRLVTLMGRRPGVALVPGTSVDSQEIPTLAVNDAIEAVLAGNLDLAVLRRQTEQAGLSTKLARHAMLPSLTLDGSYTAGAVRVTQNGEADDPFPNQGLTGSATFSMPLGNRAARGEMARSAATEAQRKNEVAGLERDLASQAAKQVRVVNNAAEQVRLTDQEVVLAEQTLRAEEARAGAGRAVQRDVLEARTALFDARVQAVRARTDRQLALAELLLLQGNLSIQSVAP